MKDNPVHGKSRRKKEKHEKKNNLADLDRID